MRSIQKISFGAAIVLCSFWSKNSNGQNPAIAFDYDANGSVKKRYFTVTNANSSTNRFTNPGTTQEKDSLTVQEKVVLSCNVYPNPTYDKLYVDIPGDKDASQEYTTTVTSASGEIIKQLVLKSGTNQFSVSDLRSGIYFLTIKTKEKSGLYKIVVNN